MPIIMAGEAERLFNNQHCTGRRTDNSANALEAQEELKAGVFIRDLL